MGIESKQIEWSDDHPLNIIKQMPTAFDDLFKSREAKTDDIVRDTES